MRAATLRQMRAFALVARYRSFAKAAGELHLTTSAVSMQVKELEHAAGLPLFDRRANSVFLTQAGEVLMIDVQHALQALQHAEEALARLRTQPKGPLKLGMIGSAKYFLPRLVAQFRARHRDVDLQIIDGNRDHLLNGLRRGEIAMAVMGSPPADLAQHAEAFADQPLGIIAAPEHELARAVSVSAAALSRYEFILREPGSGTRAALDRFMHKHQLSLPLRRELPGNEAVKQAVMANLGVAFLSLHAAALELRGGLLVSLDVEGLPISRRWYVVMTDSSVISEAACALKRFIVEGCVSENLLSIASVVGDLPIGFL